MRPRQILPPAPETEQLTEVEAVFKDWRIYQKAEENNYLCHREVYSLLHRFLLAHVLRPFVLLDLGCGDTRFILKALAGTAIRHYVGVEISKPALALAHQNLTGCPFDHRLVEQDFFEFVRDAGARADVIWMGLTFHHLPLPQKATFLHLARQILPPDGLLLMYEPLLLEDETREQFLERSWLNLNRAWPLMSREELRKIQSHVARCDFPEKFSLLTRLGREQGFAGAEQLFQDPARLFSLICFRA